MLSTLAVRSLAPTVSSSPARSAPEEAAAAAEGLPAQQHQALLAIAGRRPGEPASVGYLAEQLLIAEAIVSHEQAVRYWQDQIHVAATATALGFTWPVASFHFFTT